jgi:hypothetical protein
VDEWKPLTPGAATWNADEAEWPDLLEAWSFINEFREATGCAPCALYDFAAAVVRRCRLTLSNPCGKRLDPGAML